MKIINKKDVCITKVKRTEHAYVISYLDYNSNLKIVKNYFDEKGIALAGRFAEFKYLNMDACIESSINYLKKISELMYAFELHFHVDYLLHRLFMDHERTKIERNH